MPQSILKNWPEHPEYYKKIIQNYKKNYLGDAAKTSYFQIDRAILVQKLGEEKKCKNPSPLFYD